MLPGQDGEDRLTIHRGVTRLVAVDHAQDVVDARRSEATDVVWNPDGGELGLPAAPQALGGPGHLGLGTPGAEHGHLRGAGGIEPSIGQGFFDLNPAFGERAKDLPGDTCHFAQTAVPHLPGEAQRGELGA